MLSLVGRVLLLLALVAYVTPAPSSAWADDDATAEHSDVHVDDHGHDAEGLVDDDGHGVHGDHEQAGLPPLLQFDFGSAVCNLLIFLGVLAVLSKFVWPVILGGLKAREDKIYGDLQAAERANADAKRLLSEYQSKLDDAASQVQAMLATARKDSEASGQRIIDEAKAEAGRQRDRAVSEIQNAKQVAIAELAGQTSDMAIHVAKQVVQRELKASDHADLIRKSLDSLPSNN